MTTSKELLEQRAVVVKNMDDMHKLREEQGEWTGEDRSAWEKMVDDVESLKTRADMTHQLEIAKRANNDASYGQEDLIPDGGGDGCDGLGNEQALTYRQRSNAFTSWALGTTGRVSTDDLANSRRAGYAVQQDRIAIDMRTARHGMDRPLTLHDAHKRSTEYRAQSVGTATAGGNLVADSIMAAIDIAMLQFGGMRNVSTIVSTDTGADLPVPTSDDTSNKGAILTENTQAGEQDLTVGQTVLGAYKYSSLVVRASFEYIQDSNTDANSFIGSMLGVRLARIQNEHATTGTGTSQPTGIVAATGGAANSSVTAAAGAALTFSEILQLKHSVDPSYRGPGSGFMGNDTTLRIMKEISDSQGRPLWLPSLQAGEPDLFDGHPLQVNQDMPSGTGTKALIFGQLDKYMLREVSGIQILRLIERYADFGQVGFIGFMRFDGALIDAGTNPVQYLTMG